MDGEFLPIAASFWQEWSPIAGVIGGFATGIAAAFAGGALWYARTQIKSNRQVALEQEAQSVYSEYLRLCIEYPEFSSATLAKKKLKIDSFADISNLLTEDSERYLWFVSYMLSACEKIRLTCPDDCDWEATIRSQISYHGSTLLEIWKDMEKHYSPELRSLVEDELPKLTTSKA